MKKRIVIIGTSCSGKSTLAKKISKKLNIIHYELDQYYWKENWTTLSNDEFKNIVQNLISNETWVICGNYSNVRNIIWNRSTDIIWLNYPFYIVFFRAIKRSFIRALKKEIVCNGNIETFRQSFFSKDSIILWVIKTYWKRKKEYLNLLANISNKKIHILKNQTKTNIFFKNINKI
jgi:adenylate kinase family enzyme